MANRLPGFLVVGLSLGFAACGGDSLTLPPTTGTLEITTSTTGSPPDADGYTLQVDAQQPQAIGSTATVTVEELTPGTHSVVLTGLAANCSVSGENPRAVNIAAGETTTSTFELTCSATTGALEVTTQTSGPSPDPDGYAISLDGTEMGPIGPAAVVTLNSVVPGSHVVGLAGLAANCQVDGGNLQAVTITSGATATVTFAVTCVALPPEVGTLRITTTTSGPNQDTGYEFAVDGGQTQPIGPNSSATVASISAGNHSVVLSDVAANCTVDGGASKDVIITAGATTTLNFNITCSLLPPTVGSIHVITTTTGPDQDPSGYAVRVDGGAIQAIEVTGEVSFANITPGSHTVHLLDVAANCTADDDAKDVAVAAGATAEVSFSIICTTILPSASRSDVSVNPDNIPAGTSSTITVTVKDASGKRLVGVAVTATSSGTGNQFTGTPATTDANGVATFSFSSTVAEKKTITVTAGGVTLDDKPVITVFLASSKTVIVSHEPNPSTVGETVHVVFTVTSEQGGGTPTGTVNIFSFDDSDPLLSSCSVPVEQGSCDIKFSTNGTLQLDAVYSGDTRFEDSSDRVEHTVNAAPTAAFEVPSCTPGVACQFTDGSSDPDGNNTLTAWSWDFGDLVDNTSNIQNPTHTYAIAGDYTVTLAVTDNVGAGSTVSHPVTTQ
jgi:PKD repeat protein